MTSIDTAGNPTGSSDLNPLSWRQRWLGMDGNPAAIAWAQTVPGKAVLHAAVLSILFVLPFVRTKHFVLIAGALLLAALFPARRMAVITGVGAIYFLLRPLRQQYHYGFFDDIWSSIMPVVPSQAALVGFGLVFMVFVLALVQNVTSQRIVFAAKRPVLFTFLLLVTLVATTVALPNDSALFPFAWIPLGYLSGSFFFLGYLLLDQRVKANLPATTQVGFLRPIWADGAVPIKGPAYLNKFKAKDAEELAVTQLKALKLTVWAGILCLFWYLVFDQGLYTALGVPRLNPAIVAGADGNPVPLAMRWIVVAADFLATVAIYGASVHALVAVVRMAGFRIPRGMVSPLGSRTIAEFWGRYLFYFKEILADFFFYPTFQRWFKRSPRLRIAFATFMAAFVGNILFDMIGDSPTMAYRGFFATIENVSSYMIYAGVLTAGIIWSQLAQKRPTEKDGWFRFNVMPRAQVIVFFALLQVFDDSAGVVPVGERISFFLSLFGVTT